MVSGGWETAHNVVTLISLICRGADRYRIQYGWVRIPGLAGNGMGFILRWKREVICQLAIGSWIQNGLVTRWWLGAH